MASNDSLANPADPRAQTEARGGASRRRITNFIHNFFQEFCRDRGRTTLCCAICRTRSGSDIMFQSSVEESSIDGTVFRTRARAAERSGKNPLDDDGKFSQAIEKKGEL